MVKLTVGATNWTGVMVSADGKILTTSAPLGTAPLVTFRTFGGVTGQAWVLGRDDVMDIALLEVISPIQTYPFIEVALEDPPERSEDLGLLHYRATSTVPDQLTSSAVGSRQDSGTGVDYMQLQGFSAGTEHGGAVIDALGRLRGLRMRPEHMITLGIGRTGEAWAMASFPLAASAISRLESGYSDIRAIAGQCTTPGAPPPIPSIMVGDITVGGSPAPVGTKLYINLTKPTGAGELWFPVTTTTTGRYFATVSICDPTFNNGPAEFWRDAVESAATTTYVPGVRREPTVTFP